MKDNLVLEIVDLEWEMFSSVNNLGGKASCQEDYDTFKIMRTSQAEVWNDKVLQSYHDDLVNAKSENRNLMTEKYAFMMETTYPDEFKRLVHLLPIIDEKALDLIEKAIKINLDWKIETAKKYPNLTKKGRPIFTTEDLPFSTSFETYLRCELKVLSLQTIQLFYEMTLDCLSSGKNLEEMYLLNTVRKYGYESLDHAEEFSG